MDDFDRYLEKRMKAPAFAVAYEAMRPEIETRCAIISARSSSNMTQADLAKATGIRQSNLSRIESGMCSPTVETLARIAAGLGKQLKIEFI